MLERKLQYLQTNLSFDECRVDAKLFKTILNDWEMMQSCPI